MGKICTHACHSRRKVLMGLEAQSPKGRREGVLEKRRPSAGLTKTGVLELLIKMQIKQNSQILTPNLYKQSQQNLRHSASVHV